MRLRGATANTKLGQAIRQPLGLQPIFDCDFWLLQEVHRERDKLDKLLDNETDLKVAYAADDMGLAIAVRKGISVLSTDAHIIRETGKLAMRAKGICLPGSLEFRQRARGVIRAQIMIEGTNVTLATAHPPIPHDRSHTSHIEAIAPILNTTVGPLVFGGDMNHWPGPKECDLKMAQEAGLTLVDIGNQTTWHANKSRQKPVATVLGFFGVSYDGQLDAMYTRHLENENAQVVSIASDHDAIMADFYRRQA